MFVCAGAAGLRWFLTHSWWFLRPPERSPQSRVCQRQQPQQQAGSEGRAAEAEGRGGGGTGARGGGRAETGHQRGEREGGGGDGTTMAIVSPFYTDLSTFTVILSNNIPSMSVDHLHNGKSGQDLL